MYFIVLCHSCRHNLQPPPNFGGFESYLKAQNHFKERKKRNSRTLTAEEMNSKNYQINMKEHYICFHASFTRYLGLRNHRFDVSLLFIFPVLVKKSINFKSGS